MTHSDERTQVFRFGDFEADVPAHELRHQGARVRLQDQPFQVLRVLLERAGQVVTRDEFRQRVWPSSVFVDFDHGLNNAIARLREVLADNASAPRYIETVPRLGYRFLEEVTSQPRSETGPAAARGLRRPWIVPIGGAGALVIGLLAYLGVQVDPADKNARREAPSIAVLPFVSMGPEPESDYFSDGLTEELVHKLSGVRGLKLVARTSTSRYRNSPEPMPQIAAALGVNHVLEGSVRQSDGRLRITAQLIDAEQDRHIWSQTFDRPAGDIFQIQEDIARAVAEALQVSLLRTDEDWIRRRGTDDPEAYRLYLIAQSHLLLRTAKPDLEVARRSLEAAIELDPEFAAAHAGLSRYYHRRAFSGLIDTEDSSRLGIASAERAVALDPESSDARMALADFEFWRYRFQGDYGAWIAAEQDMQRAISLDPTNSVAYEAFGNALLWHEPSRAISLLERAIQVDLLCTRPNQLIASVLGNQGQLEAGRRRCADLLARFPEARICDMAVGTLETYYGNFTLAVPLLQASEKYVGGAARIQLWSIYMSAGDHESAAQWLDFGRLPMEKPLSTAARHAMAGRHDLAYATLDRHRGDYPQSRLLDLPAAKFALLAGKPQQAREILEDRLPDVASGIEPITARNVLPAIDLATARMLTGDRVSAYALLAQVSKYLEGDSALGLPLYAVQRARIHALLEEDEAAMAALERAGEQGLRAVWAIDLRPQSFLYIDPLEADPAFARLRSDPRFAAWIRKLKTLAADELRKLAEQPAST